MCTRFLATKLGALFVANHHGEGVEFRKLTLWGCECPRLPKTPFPSDMLVQRT